MYRRCESAWHLRLGPDGRLAPVRLAGIDGPRSPALTGAQRMPIPPLLPDDGGRGRLPFVHDPAAYAALAASLRIDAVDFDAEINARASFLLALARHGVCDIASVASAIAAYPTLPPYVDVDADPGPEGAAR
jgi:hypothetical protein